MVDNNKNEGLSEGEMLWEMLHHVVVGSALFVLVGAPAVGLYLLIKWLETELGVGDTLIFLLTCLEILLVLLDVILTSIYLVKHAINTVRKF